MNSLAEIQLVLPFDDEPETNELMPAYVQTQRDCLNGTGQEKPMQQFVDWWWRHRRITGNQYAYRLPPESKTWGLFECFFRGSSGHPNGQRLVYLDDNIPQRIADALNLELY